MRRRLPAAASLLALAVLTGCGGTAPDAPAPTALPATPAATALGAPTPGPSASASASRDPVGSEGAGAVVRDDSLLAILPADLDGIPVTAEEESLAEAAADPAFAANVARAAFAIAVAPGDLATGVVAELIPGVWSDRFFEDWRETYDEGACAQAGGVVANAQAELGGRTVFITSCDGGLRVYHAYLAERGVLVSLISLGEDRFGERLMAGLRP